MTPMWILLRHLARRHWLLLSLGPLLTSALVLLPLSWLYSTPDGLDYGGMAWFTFLPHLLLTGLIAVTMVLKVANVWQTLPLSHSALSTLAWCIMTLLPPVLLSAALLPLPSLLVWTGGLPSGFLFSLLLFLLISFLLSGLDTFLAAVSRLELQGAATLQHHRMHAFLPYVHRGRILLVLAVGGIMLYRLPWHWSSLTPRHLVGMSLAAAMTCISYRLRHALLPHMHQASGLRPNPSALEAPPRRAPTYLAWLRNDLLRAAPRMIILPPLMFCAGYVAHKAASAEGANSLRSAAILTIVVCAAGISSELERIAHIKVYRALPLSAAQCALLLLAYPCALSLIAVSYAAAFLWMAGLGQFPTLLAWTALVTASSIPFSQFLNARFGMQEGFLILLLTLFALVIGVVAIAIAYGLSPAELLTLSLWEGVAIGLPLALASYYGLRRLIENSSALYKRAPELDQFGQESGR